MFSIFNEIHIHVALCQTHLSLINDYIIIKWYFKVYADRKQ